MLLLVTQTLWRIGSIHRLRCRARLTSCDGYTLAEHNEVHTPFSFLRTIFLGTTCTGVPREQIICHEVSHVRHGHSAERLAMESLRCLCWFNPFVWLAGRWQTEVHEWQVDRDVLDAGYDVTAYRTTIFHQLFGYNPDITCGLNHSLTKKRFVMMTQFKESKFALVRLGAVIPMVVGLICLCSFTTRPPEVQTSEVEPVSIYGTFNTDLVMNMKAYRVVPIGDGAVSLAGNASFWLDEKMQVQCDSMVRYADGTVEWLGNVVIEVAPNEVGAKSMRVVTEYGLAYTKEGQVDWMMGPRRLLPIGITNVGGYRLRGEEATLEQLAAAMAWYPEVVKPYITVEITAESEVPMLAIDKLKRVIRENGLRRVAYRMSDGGAVERMLPPVSSDKTQVVMEVHPEKEQQPVAEKRKVAMQTNATVRKGAERIKERNVFFVNVNASAQILGRI